MKYKVFSLENMIVLFLGLVVATIGLIFMSRHLEASFYDDNNKIPVSQSSPVKYIDVEKIVNSIKEKNDTAELKYESKEVEDFRSLIYKVTDIKDVDKIGNVEYKCILISAITGEEIEFVDLIKKDKISDFNNRELELLRLKYPEFIVEAILNNGDNLGKKVYYVKDNEVIISYEGYKLAYQYSEPISLKINYNEIKDLVSFRPFLDLDYQNENGFSYTNNKKSIALTFDDGPSGKYNPLILDELNKNKARATFFMVGEMMNSCQKCVYDTYRSGNEVASHTYEHMNIKRGTVQKVEESIKKVNDLYYSITGDTIKYLRPPYGAYNKTNLENVNLPFIMWNMDTLDWRYRDVDHIVNYIMENAQDGSIILMHELYETSYEALKIVLPRLYAEGYQVVSIGELAKIKGRTLEIGNAYTSLR